jgi:putative sterol carrier protein
MLMVDKQTLLQALNEQRLRFSHSKVAKDFSRWNKTMQYHFTDSGEYYLIRFVEGQPQPPAQEQVSKPDIQYEMDSDTFLAINRKEITGLKAYQQKRIKLKASMPDMMKLQKIDKL